MCKTGILTLIQIQQLAAAKFERVLNISQDQFSSYFLFFLYKIWDFESFGDFPALSFPWEVQIESAYCSLSFRLQSVQFTV